MAEIITDLETIARLAEEREDEDFEFRAFVKGYLDWSDRRLDKLVREIAKEVTEAVDCAACGNCCRVMSPNVSGADMSRLARGLGLTVKEFESRYVTTNEHNEKVISQTPCPFLDGNSCSVREYQPSDCCEFPYLHKTGFRFRTLGVIERLGICPIVFNTWEALKEEFKFMQRATTTRRSELW